MNMQKICHQCKKQFYIILSKVKQGEGKFCGYPCYWKHKGRVNVQCLFCKKNFWAIKSRLRIGKDKYCSIGCYSKNKKNVYGGEKSPLWIKRMSINCRACSATFKLLPSAIKNGEGKYCSQICAKTFQLTNREPTSIEIKLYKELTKRQIVFQDQYLINDKFWVDAYVPSKNLIIEADGNYWHSLPKMMKKDKAENAYLTKCGYNLLRLSETEINNGSFKERLVI